MSLRVACAHIDFQLDGLCAVEDDALRAKVERIDDFLRASGDPPDVVVFPEGAECPAVRSIAETWACAWGTVTFCGTRQHGNHVRGTIVRPGRTAAKVEYVWKEHLSPYDRFLAGTTVQGHPGGGLAVTIPKTAADGSTVSIDLLFLICYDFQRLIGPQHNFNTLHAVFVPMFDLKAERAEARASSLAKRGYLRVFLVNKATMICQPAGSPGGLRFRLLRKLPRFILRLPWFALPSSAFGPLSPPFVDHLEKNEGAKGTSLSASRLWRTKNEGVSVANYEVGQAFAPGHDTDFGGGFFYRNYRSQSV